MAAGRRSRTDIARMCDTLFGATPLSAHCQLWAAENPRFAAFLDQYQGKIGKKLRGIHDEAGYFDLLAELETAHTLLQERSFALIYEPYLAEKQRGPDFAITFKSHTSFMVEVRHLRPSTTEVSLRLVSVLADKLRQLPASAPNVLMVTGAPDHTAAEHLRQAMETLAADAQRRDDEACQRRGFASAHDLLRRLHRLSAVGVLRPAPEALLWEYSQAQHPLSPDLRKTLARAIDSTL
jgi:hypothetical protein